MLKITLTKSLIGFAANQHRIARALGLGKTGSSVFQADTAPIRGMIHKIRHVLTVETVSDDAAAQSKAVAVGANGSN